MEDPSFFDRMISHLRATCMHYTGYPKDLGPSQVIHFTSEREFVNLLHEGFPVVVAFTIRGNYTRHLDKVLEESAAEFYPNVKFMRVECPKYPGFCITRQKKEYPFVEIFHSPTHYSIMISSLHSLYSSGNWEKLIIIEVCFDCMNKQSIYSAAITWFLIHRQLTREG
ncbi:uncharacterized protein [Glycine max]|uniref:uncharacterized protein isoform X1 n=1 Tax=Glycine max TaxID=3847 RepID=UPI001B355876|nr:uncharacterized protein LOC100808588 isoform X1 [Glycine max]